MSGYKIIDFKGLPIPDENGTAVEIPGIYAAIESSFKALLIDNLVYSVTSSGVTTNYEVNPFFCPAPVVSGGDFIITFRSDIDSTAGTASNYIIVIDDDDKVHYEIGTITVGE